eukprot:GHVU01048216.1.p1 GENE.GHVU01048216.1~~GHVU01048216.1.p1  ORF type:complete len:301 (-),score=29.16 GHVU01048216.1:268-1170(-)
MSVPSICVVSLVEHLSEESVPSSPSVRPSVPSAPSPPVITSSSLSLSLSLGVLPFVCSNPSPGALWVGASLSRTSSLAQVQLLAEKVQMTTLISPDDQDEPATLLRVLPAVVVGHLPFGYCDVNFGRLLSERRFSKKPFLGIIQRNGGNYCDLRALRLCPPSHFQPGQVLDANLLLQYNCTSVSVTGITGGHGFQGTVFRYGFNRGPMSHGSRHHRTRGSSGAGTDPGRVRPGTRMPGRMGCMKRTFSGVKVLGVNPSANLVFVRGQVPGRKKSTIVITVTDDQRVLTGTGVREIRTPTK